MLNSRHSRKHYVVNMLPSRLIHLTKAALCGEYAPSGDPEYKKVPGTSISSVSGTFIFSSAYLRQASAMTFSLRAMKSESALPLSRPLERRARSITCLRMSLPAAYSSTTA